MSKPTFAKILRRKKRQSKKLSYEKIREEIELFKWGQFLGIEEPDSTYYPTHDPTVSNHRRVIGQRIQSGRIKPNKES